MGDTNLQDGNGCNECYGMEKDLARAEKQNETLRAGNAELRAELAQVTNDANTLAVQNENLFAEIDRLKGTPSVTVLPSLLRPPVIVSGAPDTPHQKLDTAALELARAAVATGGLNTDGVYAWATRNETWCRADESKFNEALEAFTLAEEGCK